MENQHKKIKGYRDLSQQEINMMNDIKQKGIELQELISRVNKFNSSMCQSANAADSQVIEDSESYRWESIAKTHLQQGVMALTRAVAKPGFF